MLYQKGIDGERSCPADVKHSTTGTGCKTIEDTPLDFCKIVSLPNTIIYVARTDDGDGMQATLQHNCAKWHDYSRLKFN